MPRASPAETGLQRCLSPNHAVCVSGVPFSISVAPHFVPRVRAMGRRRRATTPSVVSLVVALLCSSCSPCAASFDARVDGTTKNTFIVRFDDYDDVGAHERRVTSALARGVTENDACDARARAWRVRRRENIATTSYPTDFVLVEELERGGSTGASKGANAIGEDAGLDAIRLALRGIARDVHREQRFVRRSALAGETGAREVQFSTSRRGRRLLARSVAVKMGAEELWNQGYTGAGIKMAVFDTGIAEKHPHFRNIVERTNWTNENQLEDQLGHGSFVAGVVAGTNNACAGFAPDALIHTFRVFTNDQNSYTSWFLDGFNYAIATGVHVLNLSIGGPDYLDKPFTDKVNEITASGIIMISAIGNDGPMYGTLNNPADGLDIIGVGGIDDDEEIAAFSSRGMSTWELPSGYGRMKPDIVTYGEQVWASKTTNGCRSLSGTSVASPVAAGAAVLLSSIIPESKRWSILNPAVMKQALVEGATRLKSSAHMYEQGAGKLNLLKSAEILREYEPRASVVPHTFDLTQCPYAWPHCKQGIYATMMPLMLNATIVNGLGTHGEIVHGPEFSPSADDLGALLDVRFAFSETLWPYSGYLALYVRVKDEGASESGIASGRVRFTVASPGARGENKPRVSEVEMTLRVNIIPTPNREKRLLWDQFHNVRYPPGYIPRDNIDIRHDVLDWHGDHPHTNFHQWYDELTNAGYFIEVLGSPYTCFDAKHYGALLMVDLEEEYSSDEISKLTRDVREEGLGLVVFAEWYDESMLDKIKFFDDNTHYEWHAATGGANIPALNDLFNEFGVQFGGDLTEGSVNVDGEKVLVSSGTCVSRAPAGAYVHRARLKDKESDKQQEFAFLTLFQAGKGRVFAFVDSNCVDSSHMQSACFGFARKGIEFAATGACSHALCDLNARVTLDWSDNKPLPARQTTVDFSKFSTVLGGRPGNEGSMKCGPNAPVEFHDAKVSYTDLPGRLKVAAADLSIHHGTEDEKLRTSGVDVAERADQRHPLNADTINSGSSSSRKMRSYLALLGVFAVLLVWRARRRRARRARAKALAHAERASS